ncbi:SDR family NAD(P)-dependent oxidoreductase [Alpinimonas psychrophila]|uniref:NADP-dependent 3-hydroxy acid dehydrogenase YdfG n=1 Tax=Alpinimonas psychrophila TaxID=748908 RepID=A0A7W3PN50_9MICO|nr:SDR family oxidoreductase [Alpinimonas psychrophila]MBA8828030.1 NADP-dependent 3-hydroxy acid dehydrogenase YdfG [Alpinimonas psychrophila]
MTTKRVVVTGASSGIGEATARRFRAHGWNVVGVARRAERLAKLAAETGADTFVANITKQSDVDALRDYLAKSGPVHSLVNNAGGAFGATSVEDSDPADWQRMFDVNVLGMQRVTSALLPLLRRGALAVGHADILTVTSTAGFTSYEGGGGYNAAKFAAHGVVGTLRLELAGEPIRVIEVAPGMVKTEEFTLNRFGGDSDRYEAIYRDVVDPLSADDIAETIVHALELPGHVNLDMITIRPVAQAAQHKLVRGPLTPKASS